MLKRCCFCINLRTATLLLSVLGAIGHLYGSLAITALSDEFDEADSYFVLGLTVYYYISAFACLAGAFGVVQNNLKQLRFFSTYYWADLTLHTMFSISSACMFFSMHSEICSEIVSEIKDDEFDMETCETVYLRSAWVITIAMALNMLLKLHFAFCIYNYIKSVNIENDDIEEVTLSVPYPVTNINSVEEKNNTVNVAGREFIPDEKKLSSYH